MKRSFVSVLSLTVLTVGALAQAPSPAPTAEPAAQNREHFRQNAGERPRWSGAMENRGGGEFGMERIVGALAQGGEMAKKLNLTPEQQEMIKKMALEQRTKMVDMQAALQKAALKQTELLMADPLDEAALMAAVEDTSKARTEIAKAQIQWLLEVRKVLTVEQRTQLREMMTQMRQQPPGGRPGENREGRGPQKGADGNKPAAPAPAPAAPVPVPAPAPTAGAI